MKSALLALVGMLLCFSSRADQLSLPARSSSAKNGTDFAKGIASAELPDREALARSEILSGNIPDFLRKLQPVNVTNVAGNITNAITFFVTPDYLSIGSEDDYFLTPLTPFSAQKIADALNCILPTRKMVGAIYSNAPVKLSPSPMTPNASMMTVPVFAEHNQRVRQQRKSLLDRFPLGTLTAGHKKDVVISSKLIIAPNKVAIYGWHRTNGIAIQPLYLGHTASWVDYSHGIRLVAKNVIVNGSTKSIDEVLADPDLAILLSDEGVISQPKYIFSEFPKLAATAPSSASAKKIVLGQFQKSGDEQIMWLTAEHGVRILINAPSAENLSAPKPMKLVFYALPNGSTIEQTVGKRLQPGGDWHFDIQHIGAQTRFLRNLLTNENIVVAYLENGLKSWPAWRKQFGDSGAQKITEQVCNRFEPYEPKIILTGHSGGGSFTFGYLNCVEKIPDEIERIAFLDSNYGYETALHQQKLTEWMERSDKHFLTVLAYHDDIALLNGKTFVSANGGTWGRSHLMKKDLATRFEFAEGNDSDLKQYSALNGRLQFLLKENPEKKILHTVQVERNGFIHALLTGTPFEGKGYSYLGERAYSDLIRPE